MRRAGVAHSGQGTRVWVERTRRVICAVVSSTSHASRRSAVASGNKRVRTVVADVETKAGSFFHQGCLWGNREYVSPQSQVCHAWVRRYIRYNQVGCQDIPECHITKRGQEPYRGGFPPDNMARIPPKPLSTQHKGANSP